MEKNYEKEEFEREEDEPVTLTLLLQKAGYTTKGFALAVGVKETAVYNWKNGKPIKSDNLKRACIVLQVSFKEFLRAMGCGDDLDQIPDDKPPKTVTKRVYSVAKANGTPRKPIVQKKKGRNLLTIRGDYSKV